MVDNVANKVDYGQLLKLKTDMLQNLNKHLKEPKVKKMYYSIEAQTKLLDVCELKDFKTSLVLNFLAKSMALCESMPKTKSCFRKNMEHYLANVLDLLISLIHGRLKM